MNQIFTEIIAKIKDIPLYEAILFLLYFSFSLQFNLFGIKYIITIIFLEFICCVCKNLFGNDLSHESSKEFYCLMLIIFLFGIIMNNIQFHSFKWLRIALNKLFSIKIEKVRVLTKYLDTIFKTIIGYQSTSIIVYEAFHSEQLNETLTTLVEKLFTIFFLYIALVFFSWQ